MKKTKITSRGWSVQSSVPNRLARQAEVIFLLVCLPIRLLCLWGCLFRCLLHVRSSFFEFIFLWGVFLLVRHPLRLFILWDFLPLSMSSFEFFSLWGRLLVSLSSSEVFFLWGCHPVRCIPLGSSSYEVFFLRVQLSLEINK